MRRAILILSGLAVALMATAPLSLAGKKQSTAIKRPAYGLTSSGKLVKFDARNPSRARSVGRIGPLSTGERLQGIDFRPRTGELIGLSNLGVVYRVGLRNARLTRKASLTGTDGSPVTLSGTSYGIDFNPAVDLLRVVTNFRENLRVNVDTGATTEDKPLAFADSDPNKGSEPVAVGAAYTNNDNDAVVVPPATSPPEATGTELLAIDSSVHALVLQDPPNEGVLKTIGKLGPRTDFGVGFDIYSKRDAEGRTQSNTAYVSLRLDGRTRLYTLNIKSGKAKRIGAGGRVFRRVVDIAVKP